ncbi:hypothetical protein ACFLV7_04255 [Chloroflexota bacterium]
MNTHKDSENEELDKIFEISEPPEDTMNNKRQIRDLSSSHYIMHMTVKNFFGIGRITLRFVRKDLDPEVIQEVVEAAGVDKNHPQYEWLSYIAKQSFKLAEIADFLGFLNSLEIEEVKITPVEIEPIDSDRQVDIGFTEYTLVRVENCSPYLNAGISIPLDIVAYRTEYL